VHEAQLTDDQEIAERNAANTRAALALADFITTDPTEKAAALITAATIIIEREVGRALAPAALAALTEPTVVGWSAHAGGRA
jgi:hypothetical protein